MTSDEENSYVKELKRINMMNEINQVQANMMGNFAQQNNQNLMNNFNRASTNNPFTNFGNNMNPINNYNCQMAAAQIAAANMAAQQNMMAMQNFQNMQNFQQNMQNFQNQNMFANTPVSNQSFMQNNNQHNNTNNPNMQMTKNIQNTGNNVQNLTATATIQSNNQKSPLKLQATSSPNSNSISNKANEARLYGAKKNLVDLRREEQDLDIKMSILEKNNRR